jgi:hypothetical protein
MEETLAMIPKPILVLLLIVVGGICGYIISEDRADTRVRLIALETRDFDMTRQVQDDLSKMRAWHSEEFKSLNASINKLRGEIRILSSFGSPSKFTGIVDICAPPPPGP